ncbi:MAG: hypothetical protein JW902_19080, partial [Syntrophaceae bacterium]|nr:hypothetical protein [Syntrophaceae bacterium]
TFLQEVPHGNTSQILQALLLTEYRCSVESLISEILAGLGYWQEMSGLKRHDFYSILLFYLRFG